MSKIIGNTTTTPVPRSDWGQTDKAKADFIRNKPTLGTISAKDVVDKVDLASDVQSSLEQIDTKANVVTLSTNEYDALEKSGDINTNTLYVLTDTEDVFSPIATVTQTDSGAVISITDKDGTTTANIANGETPEVRISPTISINANGEEREGIHIKGPTIINEDGMYVSNEGTIYDGVDGKSAYEYAKDGGYTGSEEEFAAKLVQEKLPNPKSLTFSGAVSGSYDGSSAINIFIPETIIDVLALPTENIDKTMFYRIPRGAFVINQRVVDAKCYVVDGLPTIGEPVTLDGENINAGYYNIKDNDVYGYLPAQIASLVGVPDGWYSFSMLGTAFGIDWQGVIGNILDCVPDDNTIGLLLEGDLWYHTYDWKMLSTTGLKGDGVMSEVFNHPANRAVGWYSHAEGGHTTANGYNSHAEGYSTTANGNRSHAECYSTTANGDDSHAEGCSTTASGDASHAEGYDTTASGFASHAECYSTTANGYHSHAEGCSTTASGDASHAEGGHTTANGYYSHAEGYYTTASGENSHVQGKFNIIDTSDKYAHIVGNGTGDSIRSNAHTVDWEGNGWFAGNVYVGGGSQNEGSKLLTNDAVNALIDEKLSAITNAEEVAF